MSIQIDSTLFNCQFCKLQGKTSSLVRSIHGLYCTDEHCYSRVTDGNLVPPTECDECKENAFYFEKDGSLETGCYLCIVCGSETAIA